jgi:hypothetical protein
MEYNRLLIGIGIVIFVEEGRMSGIGKGGLLEGLIVCLIV